jgi:hypothetical protein
MDDRTAQLEHRLSRLEARLTRQRRLTMVLTLALGATMVAAAAPPVPKQLLASAFVLVDDAGKPRGQLALTEDGSATLLVQNATGTGDVGLVVSPSGASALRLRGPKGTAALELADDGGAELRANQAFAKTAVSVGLDPVRGPKIALTDKLGKAVFQAP